MPFSPATRTSTTPTPTPTPLVATMARCRKRRLKRPHLVRFCNPMGSLPTCTPLGSSSCSSLSHSPPRRSFPSFSPLPVPFPFSLPRDPVSRLFLAPLESPLPYRSYGKASVRCVPFASTERTLRIALSYRFTVDRWKESTCRHPTLFFLSQWLLDSFPSDRPLVPSVSNTEF